MQGSDANLSAFAKDNCNSWVKDALKRAILGAARTVGRQFEKSKGKNQNVPKAHILSMIAMVFSSVCTPPH